MMMLVMEMVMMMLMMTMMTSLTWHLGPRKACEAELQPCIYCTENLKNEKETKKLKKVPFPSPGLET